MIDDALLRHLPTDERLETGTVLVDHLRDHSGKGKLTLDNGLEKDAFVKLVLNGKLVASFYVKSRGKFTFATIPNGSYIVLFCTGYGWDTQVRDFARGRRARSYDEPMTFSTRQEKNAVGTRIIPMIRREDSPWG